MCARGERLTAVDGADRYHDRNVANLEMTNAMLHRNRQNIMLISGLFSALGQHVQCAGVLGVVKRDDVGFVVRVAHGSDEQCDATDRWAGDQTKRLVDTKRRLADADPTNPRWHASTLVRDLIAPLAALALRGSRV
jgi:hypothetical protein